MSLLDTFQDSPTFDGPYISAPDINTLRDNALALDQISRRGRRAFQGSAQPQRYNVWPAQNPSRLFWGSFQYRTGLTTLTYVTDFTLASGLGTQTLQLVVNGSVVQSNTAASGVTTYTYTLSGFTDRAIAEVEIRLSVTSTATTEAGSYIIRDVYVSPYSSVATSLYGAYPGVPTFSGTQITTTQLNQLSNATDWVMRRMNVVPLPMFQHLRFTQTRDKPQTYLLWSGSTLRSGGSDQMVVLAQILNVCNVAENFQVLINGSVVAQTGNLTTGYSGKWEPVIDLSGYSTTLRLDIVIQSVITTGTTYNPPQYTRFTLRDVFVRNSNVTPSSVPVESGILESLTFSTLLSRLNAIGTMVSAAKTRIDNAQDVFDRVRLFRRRYVFTDNYNSEWAAIQAPFSQRVGEVLWLRGKSIDIGYGSFALTRNDGPDKAVGTYSYKFSNETNIIPGDKTQDAMVYLDTFEGLFPGQYYMLRGVDMIYAAQELRSS